MKKRRNGLIVSLAVLLIIVGSVGVGLNLTKIKRDIQHFEETYETKGMNTLSLDIGNEDTTIHYTNSDKIEVSLSGTDFEKAPIKASYSKDKMQLSVASINENLSTKFDIGIRFPFMEFNSVRAIDIYLPKSIQNIDIKGTSANLHVDEGISVSNMSVTINNGDVDISELNTNTLTISTTSGNIRLDEVASNKTNLEAHSGDLYLSGLLGTIKGRVTSGNINLTSNKLNQDIDFVATSGNIDMNFAYTPKSAEIKTKTASGYIELDDSSSDSDAQKTFGKGENNVSLKTTSGNILVRFDSFFDDDDD